MPAALACSLKSGINPFKPQLATASSSEEGLKAPEVMVVGITRGLGGNASCDDTGLLTLRVEWPRGTDYKIKDLGFEFRVVTGDGSSYAIFPEGPVAAPVSGRASEFLFMWNDGPPSQQRPIDVVVEIRAVTADNRHSPPARLKLMANPGS